MSRNGSGWHKDYYRHYLAAKGITTKKFLAAKDANALVPIVEERPSNNDFSFKTYNRQTTIRPVLSYPATLKEQKLVRELVEKDLQDADPYRRVLKDIDLGNYSDAITLIKKKSTPPSKAFALKTKLEAHALQLAAAGQPVDGELVAQVLPESSLNRINETYLAAQERIAREREPAARTALRKAAPDIVNAVASAPGAAVSGVLTTSAQGIAAGNKELQSSKQSGFDSNIDKLGGSSFLTDNAAVGWEEQAQSGVLKNVTGTRLSSSYDFVGTPTNNNNVLTSVPKKTAADVVSDQVDSLYNNINKLTDVSDKAYLGGKKAFKAGDREKLLKNILELRSEEDKLHDRQSLVEQTRANVLSQINHRLSFGAGDTSNNLLFSGNKGGEMLSDQSKKINEVRLAIAQRHAEIATRRKILEDDFSRLMTQVKPSTELPSRSPTVLTPKSSLRTYLGENMVADALRYGPYGTK